jgi:Ni/Co efflux regulator RcnB
MNKLLVTLLASAFAVTAFAQAPKSDTTSKAPASAEAKKAEKKPAKAKGEKKAKSKAKADEKKAATK